MAKIFDQTPDFEKYAPQTSNTISVQEYFSDLYGGKSFLNLKIDSDLVIPTPAANMMMRGYAYNFFSLTYVKHAPEGEEDSEYYYDIWFLAKNI